MAIPWLIGLGVAAVAAAVLSDDDNEKQEERDRQERREARREEERLAKDAERQRQQVLREQAEREQRQKREFAEQYVQQQSNQLIQAFGLDVLAADVKRAMFIDIKQTEALLQKSFATSKSHQQMQADIKKTLEQVAHIEHCLIVLES
jgi:hypothetical protein